MAALNPATGDLKKDLLTDFKVVCWELSANGLLFFVNVDELNAF